jgi:hypothetical protein
MAESPVKAGDPLNLMRVMPPKGARSPGSEDGQGRAGLAISHAFSRATDTCEFKFLSF